VDRGLHPSTFRHDVSAFCVVGSVVAKTAEVEARSGDVDAPAPGGGATANDNDAAADFADKVGRCRLTLSHTR